MKYSTPVKSLSTIITIEFGKCYKIRDITFYKWKIYIKLV